MILGAHTFIWGNAFDDGLLPAVERAAAMGYDSFEVAVGAPDFDADALRQLLARLGMKASLTCTMDAKRSLASPDPAVREAGRAFYRRCFELAATLGATNFVGPLFLSGSPPKPRSDQERNDEWERVAEGLRATARDAQPFGVTLCIEPVHRYKSDLINTAARAMEMIDQVGEGNLKILFDTFHANIEETSITGAIEAMGTRYLGEIHLADNDKGAPGSAHIDFAAVAASLRAIGYDGFAVFESFVPFDKDNIWRRLAPTQDDLAREALRFMRSLFPA